MEALEVFYRRIGAVRIVLALLIAAAPAAFAQTDIPQRVTNFKPRVVRVKASGQHQSEGFGFVVGETTTDFYVVTAAHVISDAGRSPRVQIALEAQAWRSAAVVKRDGTFDVAALKIKKSAGTVFRAGCLHPVPKAYLNTSVWFIGREGTWYVATLPGKINAEPDLMHRFSFDTVGVRPGNSGGPLLGSDGLLGMILIDTGLNEARAFDVRAIQILFKNWKLPWGLAECRLFDHRTAEGSVDTGKCEGPVGLFGFKGNCGENTATHRDVCVAIPDDASVDRVRLYRKWTDEPGWSDTMEARPGDDCEWCRFIGAMKRSPLNGQSNVCWEFLQWSSDQSRTARIVVEYSVPSNE
jgi:hypothetical protein